MPTSIRTSSSAAVSTPSASVVSTARETASFAIIATGIGYTLAAAALRPVERMRRHAAAVTAAVPAYARCAAGLAADVAAYLGVPLVGRDGQLFGTLCAVADRAQPLSAARGLATAEFVARMLSTLLAGTAVDQPSSVARI